MAFSVRRSVAPTTIVSSATRFLSCITRRKKQDLYGKSAPRLEWSKIDSMSFEMTMPYDLDEKKRDLRVAINEEGIYSWLVLWLNSRGLQMMNMEECSKEERDEKWKVEEITSSDTKESRMLKSDMMANKLANDIMATWRDMTAKRCWPYYDMFYDRSIIGNRFCPLIATMTSPRELDSIKSKFPIDSFSMYKSEGSNYLRVEMNIPGKHKMKVTKQGLRVSLKNWGVKREEVKTFYDYDTLFIEAKTMHGRLDSHYITGIHLPKQIHMGYIRINKIQKRHNMIKKEVKNGVLYLFIPCVINGVW